MNLETFSRFFANLTGGLSGRFFFRAPGPMILEGDEHRCCYKDAITKPPSFEIVSSCSICPDFRCPT